MRNPFEYGGVVSGDAFCNRTQELADLHRAMQNCEKLFVLSERRFGKTSLVQRAIERLSQKKHICAYVDLWPTDSEASFVTALAKSITESMSTSVGKALEVARTFFGSLVPSITLGDDGKPVLTFGTSKQIKIGPALDEVLETPARVAAKTGRNVVVVLDEFQQILEYRDELVERKLRSIIQQHRNVAYLFLGSRKHLIQKMLMDRERPLYRAGGHYPLGPIAQEHWMPFIRKRFQDATKKIATNEIKKICDLTQGHPFYTQHLCHALWELCPQSSEVTEAMIQSAVNTLLIRESYAYTTLWESFTLQQRRFLKGLAHEPSGIKPFASDFLSKYNLGSASTTQRAVATLLDRDVIDRDNSSYLITDRFFRLWIQNVQAG